MVKVNALSYAKLIKALNEGWHTYHDLAEVTGLHYVTVLNYVLALRKERMCHIHAWDLDTRGRETVAQFKLGPGKTAPKKPRLTGAQRQQRQRDKKQAIRNNLVMAGRGEYVKSANGRYRFERKETDATAS